MSNLVRRVFSGERTGQNTSSGKQIGCLAFFGENPKTDLWSQIMRILHYQKTEDPKKDHLLWQQHVLVLLVRKKKQKKKQQKQTDPHGEDKKKKQHKLGMNIRNVYISVWNTNVSRTEYTPLRIVKLLEFKIEADELFFFFTWKINRRKQTLHYVQKTWEVRV